MTTTPQRHSATIYQFPIGGLKGQKTWNGGKDSMTAVTTPPPVIIDSWYHEAAVNETKPQ
jgi:hypothetical protein